MNTRNANVIIPPNDIQTRNLISNAFLMAFGLVTFGLSGAAGLKLLVKYMFSSEKVTLSLLTLFSQMVPLALLFLLGWGSTFISVKFFENRLYPGVLRWVSMGVSFGMVFIYFYGIVKCYNERDLGLEKYAVVLFSGYLVIVAFALIGQRRDLLYSMVPLVVSVVMHIFLLVFHYIFWEALKSEFVFKDLGLMAIVVILIGLMAMLSGEFPLQRQAESVPALPDTRSLPDPD